ncbi:MAG: hypothetical protein ISR47_05515, partial [Rhodospirillales bacterium]|nr:hypothetical protein [Rhodospirillales bacterium]
PALEGKKVRITVRISDEINDSLALEAERTGLSKSHAAERRLSSTFEPGAFAVENLDDHNLALSSMISTLAYAIEQQTQKSWRHDRYTADAVSYAVGIMLTRLKPDFGEVLLPEALAQDGEDDFASNWDQPERLGANAAQLLWNQLKLSSPSPDEKHAETQALAKALGIGGDNE